MGGDFQNLLCGSERLVGMFEGDFVGNCTDKFPLMVIGG